MNTQQELVAGLITDLGKLRVVIGEFATIDKRLPAIQAETAALVGQRDQLRAQLAELRDERAREQHLHVKECEQFEFRRQIDLRDMQDELAHQRVELIKTQNQLASERRQIEELAQEYRVMRRRLGI
jgi:chromosome segregation ATPase